MVKKGTVLGSNEQLLYLLSQYYKYLLQKDSEYKLYVVSANPSPKILRLACNNIVITGFIRNPTNYFERAAVGIVQ